MNLQRPILSWLMRLFVALLTAGQISCWTHPGEPLFFQRKEDTVRLNLQLPKDRFLLGEGIEVRVTLTNTGTVPVETPAFWRTGSREPLFILTGPGFSNGETFTRPVPASQSPRTELETVEPGSSREIDFSLQRWRPLTRPGRYTLSARVVGGTWAVSSGEVSFVVELSSLLAASLAVDVGVSSDRVLRAVWLREASTGRELGETFMYEARPDLGEIENWNSRSVWTAGADARDPFCPWTNYDRVSELWSWDGWREGSFLLALPGGASQPQRIDLGSPAARIVRPALMARTGALDVVIVSGDESDLKLVRFHSPGSAETGSPGVIWTRRLPSPALSARWTQGSATMGSPRRLVVTTQEGASLALHLIDAGDGSEAGPLRTVNLEPGYGFRDAEPAIRVAEDGQTHAAVICALNEAKTELAVLDVVFPADPSKPGTFSLTRLGVLQGAFARAAATYRVSEVGPMTREWLIHLQSGEIVFSGAPQVLRHLPAPPALPLEMLRMSGGTYLLLVHPSDGVVLHPLH